MTPTEKSLDLTYNPPLYLQEFSGAINSAGECHLHTVEVTGSNPVSPTNPSFFGIITCEPFPILSNFSRAICSCVASSFIETSKPAWWASNKSNLLMRPGVFESIWGGRFDGFCKQAPPQQINGEWTRTNDHHLENSKKVVKKAGH